MITFYAWDTPNCEKIFIAFAEMRLSYQVVAIDLGAGEQFTPEFRRISPNCKLPAIVDPDGPGGISMRIFESGAILLYLGEKTGRFLSSDPYARSNCIQWLFWQTSGFGPTLGQAGHFLRLTGKGVPYAVKRFAAEGCRLWQVLDDRLSESEFVGGNELSIADMSVFPWTRNSRRTLRIDWDDFPHVRRWHNAVKRRRGFSDAAKLLRAM